MEEGREGKRVEKVGQGSKRVKEREKMIGGSDRKRERKREMKRGERIG